MLATHCTVRQSANSAYSQRKQCARSREVDVERDRRTVSLGPEQDTRRMRLLPVYEHQKLSKNNLWAIIRSKVRDLLEVQQSAD